MKTEAEDHVAASKTEDKDALWRKAQEEATPLTPCARTEDRGREDEEERGDSWRRGHRRRRKISWGIGLRNDIPNEETKSILGQWTRRSMRRNEERPRARRTGRHPRKITTKSTNRTEKKFIRKITHKVSQGTKAERARERTSLGLGLSPKLRKIRQEEIPTGGRDLSRDSLQLTHSTSSRQRNQLEDLPGKVPKRTRGERFEKRTTEKR